MSQYGNYKSERFEMMEMEIHAICTDLIIKSWWASWLPCGWMHSLAASYYAKKATCIYTKQKNLKSNTTHISGTVAGTRVLKVE
jgi:hypothetical protein